MNFCPCLQCLWKHFRKEKDKKIKGDTEEQAFINQEEAISDHIPIQPTNNIPIKNIKSKPLPSYEEEEDALKEEKVESDLIDVKMELTPPSQDTTTIETKTAPPSKNIEDLIEEELNLTPQEAVVQHAQKKEEKKVEEDLILMEQQPAQEGFTINLDPSDPFFPIIHQKTTRISEQLASKGIPLEISEPNKAHLTVSIVNSPTRMNTFLISYRLKCSYSYYQSLLKNDKVNGTLSPLIAQVKVIQALKPNLTKNTLKFKRLGSFQARDLFYIKYQNRTKRQYWQIYIQDQKAELTPHFKTCEIYCIKNIKEEFKDLTITQYIEIDLQSTNANNILPKLAQEYKNYLNNMTDHIEHNYEQEIV